MDNRLKLTSIGRQAINNASAGGLLVRPVRFKVGDSDFPHSDSHTNIQGTTLYEGEIYFVEVLSESSTRFTFYIPEHVPPEVGLEIREGAIFLENNIMLARCVFAEPYVLQYMTSTEVVAILTTIDCDLSTIDVTVGNYSSIPSTPYIHQLPSPLASSHNVISVADLITGRDGSSVPGLAIKFGQGGLQWAFSGHDKAYTGVPDAGPTLNSFKRASITTDGKFRNGEIVVVQIVSGPGAGQTRRFSYDMGNDKFVEADAHPFSIFTASSTISIWKPIESGCGGSTEEQTVVTDIPALPIIAVSTAGVDTEAELNAILFNATELATNDNQTFTINIPDNSSGSGGVVIPLRPIIALGPKGMLSEEDIGNMINDSGIEFPNTQNGFFTQDTGETGTTYGYFLAPEHVGEVTFVDTSIGIEGGWDGATWPLDEEFSYLSGPLLFTRTIAGQVTDWRLYRMDFPAMGERTFQYTFQYPNTTASVTSSGGGSGGTQYGYFIHHANLGVASFTDTLDGSINDWKGAAAQGPITIVRHIGDDPSNWYLYRTTNPGLGNKQFTVTFTNPGLTINLHETTVVPGSSGGCNDTPELPPRDTIPPDWVLTRGSGNNVVWAPQKGGSEIVSTLYTSPGKLKVTVLSSVGDGTKSRYSMGGITLKDNNYMFAALGGIYQHKTAFDIQSSEIEFAEAIPPNVSIDMRMFTKEPGNGTYVNFYTDVFMGDGAETTFRLTNAIEGPEYCFVHIRSILQATVSYSYNSATKSIVFTQPPPAGNAIEVTSMVRTPSDGYSTEIVNQQLITVGQTLFIELPIQPQSKDMTFLSVSGSHIHRDLYTIVDNNLILSSHIPAGREVEVLIFNNVKSQGSSTTNLNGVVVDAILTAKSLRLIRHGLHDISLPIPAVELSSGRGIKVTGNHPSYKIESTIAEAFTASTNFKFSTLQKENNSNEIIYSWRLNLTSDVLITVTADFSVELGPGFVSPYGLERMEYVIGFRTTSMREPDYGRQIKGTGTAGFSSLPGTGNDQKAYSNSSLTQVFEVLKANVSAGYLDIIAKMRIKDAETSKYESLLMINFNVIGTPKITLL